MGSCESKQATETVSLKTPQNKNSKEIIPTGTSNNNNNNNNSKVQPSYPSKRKQRNLLDRRTQKILKKINGIPIIQLCNEKQKIAIAKKLKKKTYNPGECLMKEGEPGNEFFLISSGYCEVFVNSKKVSELRSNDYAGEQALLSTNCKRTATVKATETTTVLVMSKKIFDEIVRSTSIQFVNRQANLALSEDEDDLDDDDEDDNDGDEIISDNEDGDAENLLDEDTLEWLMNSVSNNLLFEDLELKVIKKILNTMTLSNIKKGECIIKQNSTHAKEFYVIDSGEFQVEKNEEIVDQINRGNCVGELALVFNAKRNATVRSITSDSKVWILKRSTYRKIIKYYQKKEDAQKIKFLRKVPLLASLFNKEISLFARSLNKVILNGGSTIFNQGDTDADKFYLIMDGIVEGNEVREDNSIKQFQLSKGEFFGEIALKYNKPRSATIQTKTNCVLLVAKRDDFDRLFGSMDKLMERQLEEYQRPIQSDKEYRLNLFKRSLDSLEQGPVIGRGKYGLVQFVRDPQNGTVYALKAIKKTWVTAKKVKQTKRRIKALYNERNVMKEFSTNNNPFLIKLRGTFKDTTNIYFLMEAALGGDFFNILKLQGSVSEKVARFHIACIIEAIGHLHDLNMIHRDLKPENIVIDDKGYSMLTDFGFTKKLKTENGKTYTLCGTPGYMAPEVILGKGYGKGSDWFSIGCVLYDMSTGAPPFPTRADQFTMIKEMMQNKLHLPMYLSFWCKDLICQLLKTNPTKRLGIIKGGIQTIRNHSFFQGFDWNALREKTLKPPFVPKLSKAMDSSNFDTENIEEMTKEIEKYEKVYQLPTSLANWDVDF